MRTQQNLQAINAIASGNFNSELLEKYSGYGGISKELSSYDYYKKLNAIISKEKIAKLKESTKSAFYTPGFLVEFIYKILQKLGFKGGNILEPSAGNGIFIKHMPEEIRKNSKILAIDSEPFALKIAKTLYPDVFAICKNFENVEIKNNSVDLIIGNPPYGKWTIEDAKNPDLAKYVVHHYFAARSVRLLKKNGILVFVINQYFMDNIRDHVRDVIEKEGGSLLAAYRLPNNLFSNVEITTDIVFIVKNKLPTTKWFKTKPITINNQTKRINEYFVCNPQNILGRLDIIPIREKTRVVCKPDGDLQSKLNVCIENFPQTFKKPIIENYLEKHLRKNFMHILKSTASCLGMPGYKTWEKPSFPKVKLNEISNGVTRYFKINISFLEKPSDKTQEIHLEAKLKMFVGELLKDRIKHKVFVDYESCCCP